MEEESTTKDYKLRLVVFNEWKSKVNVDETKIMPNIQMEKDSITIEKIQKYSNDFSDNEISIFEKHQNISIRDNPMDSLNSLLFLSDERDKYAFRMIKCCDRFIEYFYKDSEGDCSIVQYDLFLGERKEIKVPFNFFEFEVIGDEFLLVFDNILITPFFKPNHENSSFNLLDSIDLNKYVVNFLVDQLNPLKFMVFMEDHEFALGEIRDGKIVLAEFRSDEDIGIHAGNRLINNKYQSFYYEDDESIEFYETDLDTMEETKTVIKFDLENAYLDLTGGYPDPYCWSGNRFYGMFRMIDGKYHVLMLDLDELKWTEIGISAFGRHEMFVDSNDVLTLNVGEYREVNAFYRLVLRKPDSLKNLAHFSALRQSTLFGKDKYLECVKKLPIQWSNIPLN